MGENVIEILVKRRNATKAGFQGAVSGAEAAAGSISAIFSKMGGNVNKHLAGIGSGLGVAGGILGAGSGLLAMAGPIGAAGRARGRVGGVALPVPSQGPAATGQLTRVHVQV